MMGSNWNKNNFSALKDNVICALAAGKGLIDMGKLGTHPTDLKEEIIGIFISIRKFEMLVLFLMVMR